MDNKQDDGLIDWDPQTMHVQDLLKMTDPQDDTVKVPSQPVPVHRFASELSDFVVKNMRITLANGLSEAKISLAPEHLGHVDVKITVHNGQVVAQFMADSAAGKEMLESQIVQLRANLQNQGVQVERIEVTQSSSMQSAMFQDSRQQSQQQSNQSGKGKSGTNQTGFEGSLDDSEQEAVRRAAANSSFDVTA
jgi:flagellar hook-length control protein FliK